MLARWAGLITKHFKCFRAGEVNPDWSNAVSIIQIRDLTGV